MNILYTLTSNRLVLPNSLQVVKAIDNSFVFMSVGLGECQGEKQCPINPFIPFMAPPPIYKRCLK